MPNRNIEVRWRMIAATLAMLLLVPSPKTASAVKANSSKLSSRQPLFWRGPPAIDGTHDYPYDIRVPKGRNELRIAIDVPSRTDWYKVTIADPGNHTWQLHKRYAYSAEIRLAEPRQGAWHVVVTSQRVTSSTFRLRASLASQRQNPLDDSPLLPNLRAVPPFNPTFSAPDDGGGSDYDNDDTDKSPPPGISCAEDEVAEDHAVRCLRFSGGIDNTGQGPLDLRFDTTDPEKHMFQAVHHSDRTVRLRPAGSFEYHQTHNHFHYANIWAMTLLKVVDEKTGEMEEVGLGRKSGFCPADQGISSWHRFNQDVANSVRSDCGMTFTNDGPVPKKGPAFMGLSTGWGDVYGWYRPGNYVEFGMQADGLYVIREVVDPDNHVKERDEQDNAAYALVRVTGLMVSLIERGRGRDPWDQNKVVRHNWWN